MPLETSLHKHAARNSARMHGTDLCLCCLAALHHPPLLLLSPPLTRAPRTAHDSILIISRALSFSAQVQRAVQQACMGNTQDQRVQVWGVGGWTGCHEEFGDAEAFGWPCTLAQRTHTWAADENSKHSSKREKCIRFPCELAAAAWYRPCCKTVLGRCCWLGASPPAISIHSAISLFSPHTLWHHFWQQRTQQLVCGGEDAHPRSHVIELTANLEHVLDRHLARGFEEERWGVRFVRL